MIISWRGARALCSRNENATLAGSAGDSGAVAGRRRSSSACSSRYMSPSIKAWSFRSATRHFSRSASCCASLLLLPPGTVLGSSDGVNGCLCLPRRRSDVGRGGGRGCCAWCGRFRSLNCILSDPVPLLTDGAMIGRAVSGPTDPAAGTCNQREIYQSPACIYKADSIKHVLSCRAAPSTQNRLYVQTPSGLPLAASGRCRRAAAV